MAPCKSRKTRKSRSNRSSRKSRSNRSNRRNRSRRNARGGFMAPVNDTSMAMAQRNSLAQGGQYLSLHKGQYGGSVGPYPSSVVASMLPSNMVASARTGPLDTAIAGIRGMQDGGLRKNRKQRKHTRKHRGGRSFEGSPLSSNSMLLPPGLEKQAALNYEWSMAKDPSAFAPKA